MNWVRSSIDQIETTHNVLVNPPINLEECKTFAKKTFNKAQWAIMFGEDNNSVGWYYEDHETRDKDYERLLRIVINGKEDVAKHDTLSSVGIVDKDNEIVVPRYALIVNGEGESNMQLFSNGSYIEYNTFRRVTDGLIDTLIKESNPEGQIEYFALRRIITNNLKKSGILD
jgi:hypothetical protein|tara:strand:+ start:20 stop:532 length:513 start_codon:yes stop_codon:yes gene_type:complete